MLTSLQMSTGEILSNSTKRLCSCWINRGLTLSEHWSSPLTGVAQDTESVDLEGHTGADGQRVVVDTILGWRLPLTDAERADEQ